MSEETEALAERLRREVKERNKEPDYFDQGVTQDMSDAADAIELLASSQAFSECEKIADDFHHGYTDQGTEGLYGREAKVCSFISQAIRQHSQKGRDTE